MPSGDPCMPFSRFEEAGDSCHQDRQEEEEGACNKALTPSTCTPLLRSRVATASSQGRVTSESVTFDFEGEAELELPPSVSQTHSQADPQCEETESSPQTAQVDLSASSKEEGDKESDCEPESGVWRIESQNYLKQRGLVFKPKNPFQRKEIIVYSVCPLKEFSSKQSLHKSSQPAHVHTPKRNKQTASQNAYVIVDAPRNKVGHTRNRPTPHISYLKLTPGCPNYTVPADSVQDSVKTKSYTLPSSWHRTAEQSNSSPNRVSNFTGMDIYSPVATTSLSRTQEKVELQQLNDRFASYVHHVRLLAERNNQVDSSAIIKSTKAMEMEIQNLKNMYEQELEKLRKELENCNHEKTSHQVQVNKQLQYSAELQDRLNVETDKNGRLLDEINNLQRKMGSLEAEIQDLRIVATRPRADIEQQQRAIDNLTRELETWKHRYEHEQVVRQEAENKIQQLMQKSDFNDKVTAERVGELNTRIESSAATILSLEAKIRDLSKTDVSVSELLKQVRETAEAELRKYQVESEEQYSRNLTALKAQMDNDVKAVERLETERTQLRGSVGELQAKIRNLEGQVATLEHQKQTLEDAMAVERNRAADGARALERKLREVQDMLVVKMREVTSAREQNIPLKAEIEALKVLLEEEEKRLKLTLMTSSSASIAATTTATTTTSALPLALPSTLPPIPPPPSSSPTLKAVSTQSEGLRVPMGITSSSLLNPPPDPTSFVSSYNITTTTTPAFAPTATPAFAPTLAPTTTSAASVTFASQPPTSTAYPPLSLSSTQPLAATTTQNTVSFAGETRPYVPSPPLSVTYVPEALQTPVAGTPYDAALQSYQEEMDQQMYAFADTVPLAKYSYETTPALNRLSVEPSPPTTPRAVGPIRAKSAPVERQRNLNLVSNDLGQGHDYFDQMFHDLQRDTLKGRPKSSPMRSDRPLSSLYHDYTVSTSSATGDLKIFEVHPEGKYVRLLNDGVQEVEFGGFMLQQNVGGHPVAVYRFAPRTKFAPNSTITVYAGCNDHKLHNPPTDFVWKEQQKWGTGPECTTILCRPNGQAVAWTTAAHRFTRDTFQDGQSEADDDATRVDEERQLDEVADDESLTEISVNVNGPKPDPVYLRREKQQPPSLQANKHPHGSTVATPIHPHSGQARPLRYGNDNSSNNRQSRSQSSRPDPVPGQPYAGASAQKMGSAPLRKYVSGVSTQPKPGIRVASKSDGVPGEASEVPSPFMKPHTRFQTGLDQVQSQHHQDFLPPMPRPPLFTTW